MKFLEVEIPRDFELIPSLAVMVNTPVMVRDEKYSPIIIKDEKIDAVSLSKALSEEFGSVHYLDILGIRKGVVEWNLFQEIVERCDDLWADVGIIYSDGLIDVIMAGAKTAIITTKMIDSMHEIVSSFELTENLILQLDHDKRLVSKDQEVRTMGPVKLVEEMVSFGMNKFILDDIRPERKRTDPDLILEVLSALPNDGKLYVGIEEIDEIEELANTGVKGAVISCSRVIEGLK